MKGAIFDLDGVLADSHPAHFRAWKRLLDSIGKPIQDHDVDFILEGRKRREILEHFLGTLSDQQLDDYGRQKEAFFLEESKNIQIIDGVRELLQKLMLASISLAVASCGTRNRVNDLLERLDLRPYFQSVITGDDVKEGKPDPSIFLLASECYGIAPQDSLCLEDSVSGVMAAKAAGMKCLGVGKGGRGALLLEVGADKVVPDFVHLSIAELQSLFN